MGRNNNFDALRFWAALAVLWGHSFPLGANQPDPLDALTHGQTSIGGIAVAIFFVISGYLITGSYRNSPRPLRFMKSRALRIFPGLIAVLLLTAFVVGPLITTLPLREYFLDPLTYKFAYHSLPIFKGNFDELPGVFLTSNTPKSVNGSLWTLNYEFRCYLLVLLFGMVGLLNRVVMSIGLTLLLALIVFMDHSNFLFSNSVILTAYFFAGSILFLIGITPNRFLVAACLIAIIASLIVGARFPVVMTLAGSYIVICIGISNAIRIPYLSRFGDLSYGTYIYAFTVQQIVALTFASNSTWLINAAVSTPIVVGLAALSWRYVEKPALDLKSNRLLPYGGS